MESPKFMFSVNPITPPVIFIENKRISVVSFLYSYRTRTEEVEGESWALVKGYLHGEDLVRTYKLNCLTGDVYEIPPFDAGGVI